MHRPAPGQDGELTELLCMGNIAQLTPPGPRPPEMARIRLADRLGQTGAGARRVWLPSAMRAIATGIEHGRDAFDAGRGRR